MTGHGRCLSRSLKAQLLDPLLDCSALGAADVAEQQILIRGQPDLQLIRLHQAPQSLLELSLQTTADERQPDKPQTLTKESVISFDFTERFVFDRFGGGLKVLFLIILVSESCFKCTDQIDF